MNNNNNAFKIFNNQYMLKKRLSQGSYGIVFEGEDMQNKQGVAVKIERKDKVSTLDREIHLLSRLLGTQGVPKLLWSGCENNCNVLVQQLLTKDLGAYLKEFRKFSLKTILLIADQLLHTIRRIHNKSIVHRDLKPENIMQFQKQIYIVDFGIGKLYRDTNLKHMPFKESRSFVGTTRYASIAAHKGHELSRKDDLECLLYIFVLMFKGNLPWQHMQASTNKERQRLVGDRKSKISSAELCHEMPPEFIQALDYIKQLTFYSDPDYDYLIQLFRKLAAQHQIVYDDCFDWTKQSDNISKCVTSLIQFERQSAFSNKCQSLKVPSSADVLEKNSQNNKQSLVSFNSSGYVNKKDTQITSLKNTFQPSMNQIEDNDRNDEFTIDEIADTLFDRYQQLLLTQVVMQPTLMRFQKT